MGTGPQRQDDLGPCSLQNWAQLSLPFNVIWAAEPSWKLFGWQVFSSAPSPMGCEGDDWETLLISGLKHQEVSYLQVLVPGRWHQQSPEQVAAFFLKGRACAFVHFLRFSPADNCLLRAWNIVEGDLMEKGNFWPCTLPSLLQVRGTPPNPDQHESHYSAHTHWNYFLTISIWHVPYSSVSAPTCWVTGEVWEYFCTNLQCWSHSLQFRSHPGGWMNMGRNPDHPFKLSYFGFLQVFQFLGESVKWIWLSSSQQIWTDLEQLVTSWHCLPVSI